MMLEKKDLTLNSESIKRDRKCVVGHYLNNKKQLFFLLYWQDYFFFFWNENEPFSFHVDALYDSLKKNEGSLNLMLYIIPCNYAGRILYTRVKFLK